VRPVLRSCSKSNFTPPPISPRTAAASKPFCLSRPFLCRRFVSPPPPNAPSFLPAQKSTPSFWPSSLLGSPFQTQPGSRSSKRISGRRRITRRLQTRNKRGRVSTALKQRRPRRTTQKRSIYVRNRMGSFISTPREKKIHLRKPARPQRQSSGKAV